MRTMNRRAGAGENVVFLEKVFRFFSFLGYVRFLRGRKFSVFIVGGHAASCWPINFLLRVHCPYIS